MAPAQIWWIWAGVQCTVAVLVVAQARRLGCSWSLVAAQPALKTSTGTIRLRPQDGDGIADAELLGLLGAALAEPTAI